MIIKSMSRKSADFLQLLGYINKQDQQKNKAIFHNLESPHDDINAIYQEFFKNSTFSKKIINGVQCYHEILSLPQIPRSYQEKFPEILDDLAQKYLNLRIPNGLGYAKAHLDTDYPHIHFCLSANNYRKRNKNRLSKGEFNQVKQRIRAYIREKYPELEPQQKEKYQQIIRPKSHRKNHGQTIKEQLSQKISDIFLSEKSLEPVLEGLKISGIAIYHRGTQKLYGVKYGGKKYRLKTLGIRALVDNRVKQWKTTEKRLGELEKIQEQKEQIREKEKEQEQAQRLARELF